MLTLTPLAANTSSTVSNLARQLSEAAVRAFAGQKLASYKVPRRVLFVAAEDLAMTGSAKVKTADLRLIAERALAGED